MPPANQGACAAHIWAAFVTDKPNLCLRAPVHLPVLEEKGDVTVTVFCVSVPECVFAVVLHGQVQFVSEE